MANAGLSKYEMLLSLTLITFMLGCFLYYFVGAPELLHNKDISSDYEKFLSAVVVIALMRRGGQALLFSGLIGWAAYLLKSYVRRKK
jgi:hypothetical protein